MSQKDRFDHEDDQTEKQTGACTEYHAFYTWQAAARNLKLRCNVHQAEGSVFYFFFIFFSLFFFFFPLLYILGCSTSYTYFQRFDLFKQNSWIPPRERIPTKEKWVLKASCHSNPQLFRKEGGPQEDHSTSHCHLLWIHYLSSIQ